MHTLVFPLLTLQGKLLMLFCKMLLIRVSFTLKGIVYLPLKTIYGVIGGVEAVDSKFVADLGMSLSTVKPGQSSEILLIQVHGKKTIKNIHQDIEMIHGKYVPYQFLVYWLLIMYVINQACRYS
uniref:Uncharacterized protein n=2 Tax=Helianthus annuus TaxID=4232 RepID=A0A251UQF0_HELAN